MDIEFKDFIERNMRQGKRLVAARLQAAMALLERLRDVPSLRLDSHKKPNSAGLDSHETYGNQVHARLGLEKINKNHGRRSSNVGGWGQELLDRLKDTDFDNLSTEQQGAMIDAAQKHLATLIRDILEQEPLKARLKGRSVESVISDILKQAEAKGKSGDVAQYIVGAKLMLRFNRDMPIVASNKGDRRSLADTKARTGDFEIENATIEVAVGLPDEKHLTQVVDALEDTDLEVWLLTRHDHVDTWRHELEKFNGVDLRRVVVTGVESFVGQNISELGGFSTKGKMTQLRKLYKLYNERWISQVGTPAIRIVVK